MATNGKQTLRLKKTIDVGALQASEVWFDFGNVEPGTWQVTIDIDAADDLAFDNRRLAALEVNHPDRVLVLDSNGGDRPQSSSSFYLTLALRATADREVLPTPAMQASPQFNHWIFLPVSSMCICGRSTALACRT